MTESNRNRVRFADLKKTCWLADCCALWGYIKPGGTKRICNLYSPNVVLFFYEFYFYFFLSWGCLPYAFRNNNPECRYIIVVELFSVVRPLLFCFWLISTPLRTVSSFHSRYRDEHQPAPNVVKNKQEIFSLLVYCLDKRNETSS